MGTCKTEALDIIVTKGNNVLINIEDDIRADLAKIGITLNLKELEKDSTEAYTTANPDGCVGECPGQGFNDAMTSGNFHLCFSESQGPPSRKTACWRRNRFMCCGELEQKRLEEGY